MAGFSPPMQEREISVHSLNPPVLEIAEEKRSKRNPRQLDFEAVSIHILYCWRYYAHGLLLYMLFVTKGTCQNVTVIIVVICMQCQKWMTLSDTVS